MPQPRRNRGERRKTTWNPTNGEKQIWQSEHRSEQLASTKARIKINQFNEMRKTTRKGSKTIHVLNELNKNVADYKVHANLKSRHRKKSEIIRNWADKESSAVTNIAVLKYSLERDLKMLRGSIRLGIGKAHLKFQRPHELRLAFKMAKPQSETRRNRHIDVNWQKSAKSQRRHNVELRKAGTNLTAKRAQ